MSNIKTIAIERIAKQLENLGCQFKVITEDGAEFGALHVMDKPKSTRVHNRYVKETNYIELLKNIGVGEAVFVPAGTAPLDGVQSVCSSYMVLNFGKGTYMTVQHPDRNGVEVLRLE
jgi:hypothetical protein